MLRCAVSLQLPRASAPCLIAQKVHARAKELAPVSARVNVRASVKVPVLASVKEPVLASVKELVLTSVKELVLTSARVNVRASAKVPVAHVPMRKSRSTTM